MKRLLMPFLLFCFFATLFSGCVAEPNPASLCAVVTEAEITCQHKDVRIHRYYTDTTKIQWVLLYLRLLRPMGRPEIDPDTVDADIYEICLGFSDGTQRIYRQKDHRYLSVDFAPWKKIDSGNAAGLYAILRKVPSDTPAEFAESSSTSLHKTTILSAYNFVRTVDFCQNPVFATCIFAQSDYNG